LPVSLRLGRGLVLGLVLLLAAAPAGADFPGDLEGELRLLAPPPAPPLAGLGPDGQGTFRLVAGPGGDLRTDPGTAALTIPGSQVDADGDGFGNACDCDFDQDGACTLQDFGPFVFDLLGGTGGSATDMDGDGAVTISDFGYFVQGLVAGAPGPSGLAP